MREVNLSCYKSNSYKEVLECQEETAQDRGVKDPEQAEVWDKEAAEAKDEVLEPDRGVIVCVPIAVKGRPIKRGLRVMIKNARNAAPP
jgi:hypothetical protein